MAYIDDATIVALRGNVNLAIFFRVGADPVLHLCLGVNDIPAGIPVLDPDGTVYTGAGQLLSIPDLESLINGIADKVSFSVSGVAQAFSEFFIENAPPVLGALCTVGLAVLDERYQIVGSIVSLWEGMADYWAMEQQPQSDVTKPLMRTIALVCSSGYSARGFARLETYTSQAQKLKYPTDDFCNNVPRYYQGQVVSWPRYT
jgi:hypothetical protein